MRSPAFRCGGSTVAGVVWLLVLGLVAGVRAAEDDLTKWTPTPTEFTGGKVEAGVLTLSSGTFRIAEPHPWQWVGWWTPSPTRDVEIHAHVTITRPAADLHWFGQSWSVWPDPTYSDGGFEAGLGVALNASRTEGYRVQFSHKYQCVALVRYPLGGYVRVVPCKIAMDKPLAVSVLRRGRELRVSVEGKNLIHYLDPLPPMPAGNLGLLTSSRGAATFSKVQTKSLPPMPQEDPPVPPATAHQPNFSVRQWLGDRPWVFDADEPILLLPIQEKKSETYYFQIINNVKLQPGFKPMLVWNAHWDIAGQGAWPDGGSKSTEPVTQGGGARLQAHWQARHHAGRFETKTTLTIGFDNKRGTYTYDMDSQLEILPGPPFHIHAFELEHHTPLDPFNWKYLVIRKSKDELVYRPVYPIDPGPLYNIEGNNGLRMWYGRHNEPLRIAPAVEYFIEPSKQASPENSQAASPRQISTSVCAAFYDTGVAYDGETLPAGTKVCTRYRYTGYPADEAERIFQASKLIDSPRLDPNHYYVWADAWPRLTFSKGRAMSEPWWDAMPFMTAHNQRPTYKWVTNTGKGSGYALQFPPRSFGQSDIPLPKPLEPGRYVMRGWCKADRVVGPGGRIELSAFDKNDHKLAEYTHYLGTGDFDWRPYAFAFDLPAEVTRFNVAFGNAGTGDLYLGEIHFERLPSNAPLPADVAAMPNAKPAAEAASPLGAIFDARMAEGKGHYVLNFADPNWIPLELCNVSWEKRDGRMGLRFRQQVKRDRPDFARGGMLEFYLFAHEVYRAGGAQKSLAVAGSQGSSVRDYQAITLATWIRPDATMIKNQPMADILGFGSRRIRLRLLGDKAPYQVGMQFTEGGEYHWSGPKATVSADKWHHVALSARVNSSKQWEVTLYLNGKEVLRTVDPKAPIPLRAHDSLILGAELHYMDSNFYDGLIGRTLVLDRALSAAEIMELMKLP